MQPIHTQGYSDLRPASPGEMCCFEDDTDGQQSPVSPFDALYSSVLRMARNLETDYLRPQDGEEVASIAKEYNDKRREFQNLSPSENTQLKDAFRALFLAMGALSRSISWGEEVANEFEFSEEDIVSFIQDKTSNPSHKRNCLEKLNYSIYPEERRLHLAHLLLENNVSIAKIIDHFLIEDPSIRKELALKEIRLLKLDEEVSKHLQKYNFEDPSFREEIARAVIEANYAGWIQNWKNFDIESEDHLAELFYQAALKCPPDSELLKIVTKEIGSPQNRYRLAKAIAVHSLSDACIKALPNLGFDTETLERFLLEVAQENPAILFEHWAILTVDDGLKNRLKCYIPFFTLQEQLECLNKNFGYQFLPLKGALEALLASLRSINLRFGLPSLFSFSKGEDAIVALIKKVSKNCTLEELLELSHMFNSNFSSASEHLLAGLVETIQDRFPLFRHFYYVGQQSNEYPYVRSPETGSLIPPYLVSEKLLRKPISNLFQPIRTCQIFDLHFRIQEIAAKGAKRALIFLYFPDNGRHFSPCLLEKDEDSKGHPVSYKVLLSDSVPRLNPYYITQLFEYLKSCSVPLKIHSVSVNRQADQLSCSIFALSDISSAMRVWRQGDNTSAIDSLLEDTSSPHDDSVKHVVPRTDMMKLAQLSKVVNPRGEEALVRKGGRETLRNYVQNHSYVFYDLSGSMRGFRPGNLAARQKFITYFERILKAFMHNDPPILEMAKLHGFEN